MENSGTFCPFCGVACLSEPGARKHFRLLHTDDSPHSRTNRRVMELFRSGTSTFDIAIESRLSQPSLYAIIRRGLEHPNVYLPAPGTFEFYADAQNAGSRQSGPLPTPIIPITRRGRRARA